MSTTAVARPISFVTPLVQAILAGRKTQTRRLVRPQPQLVGRNQLGEPVAIARGVPCRCPLGGQGDELWVRERWGLAVHFGSLFVPEQQGVIYAADFDAPAMGRWKPARFMPRRHSRLMLKICSVRIERLSQISADDARAEGFDPRTSGDNPIDWFRKLWDELADPTTNSSSNPWVWVIGFERSASMEDRAV